jgi:hypothetical protein
MVIEVLWVSARPCKEIKTETTHTLRDDLVRTQKSGHLQSKETDLRRNHPADPLTVDFWPPER